jgi:hypothetical protein
VEWTYIGQLHLLAGQRACLIDVLQHGPYLRLRVMDATSPSSTVFVYFDGDAGLAAYLQGTRSSE